MLKTRGIALIVLGIAGAGLLFAADSPAAPPVAPPVAPAAAPPATRPATQPAKELTLDLGDKVTLKLVLIPAGKFLMGSPETEKDRDKDEIQHEVTISKPFYMGVTHVTVDQFAAFAKDSGYKTDAEKAGKSLCFHIRDGNFYAAWIDGCSWRNPGFEQTGGHPVVEISWNDAQAFCTWLAKKSGKVVGLPTEAQWEYACRAGTKTAFPWGDNADDGKGWANCTDQSFRKSYTGLPERMAFSWDDGYVFTSPVTSFKANAFGLYDMVGNANQWCQDRFGDYEKGADTDPTGANTGGNRVLRGGTWFSHLRFYRSAHRTKSVPADPANDEGFRVVVRAAGVD
jgi:formylglycine-generating enzyme